MKTKLLVVLFMAVFASEKYANAENGPTSGEAIANKNTEDLILVKIEESEYVNKKITSEYIGVTYHKRDSRWYVKRWSKNEKKIIFYRYYDNEETAAHASDTLARLLMENGEQGHKLNFPYDDTEVRKKTATSEYIGVTYKDSRWYVSRRSKNENKMIYSGYYDNEKTAAHASDTLARKLINNGEHYHKFNFHDDHTEVHPEEKKYTSTYIGVYYARNKWGAKRWSKEEKKSVSNGSYDNEETAAHASDTLARKLMEKGEQGHKLNFPTNDSEFHPEYQKKKRKRQEHLQNN